MGDRRAGDVFDRSRRPLTGERPVLLLAAGGNSEYLLAAGESVVALTPAMLGGLDMVGVVCRRADRGGSPASDSSSVETLNQVLDLRFSSCLSRRARSDEDDPEKFMFRNPGCSVCNLGSDDLSFSCVKSDPLGSSSAFGDGRRSRTVLGSLPTCSFSTCGLSMRTVGGTLAGLSLWVCCLCQ